MDSQVQVPHILICSPEAGLAEIQYFEFGRRVSFVKLFFQQGGEGLFQQHLQSLNIRIAENKDSEGAGGLCVASFIIPKPMGIEIALRKPLLGMTVVRMREVHAPYALDELAIGLGINFSNSEADLQ